MKTSGMLFLGAFVLSLASATTLSAATFRLDEATIVRNDSAGRILITAADELALHLKLIGGKEVATGFEQGKGLTFNFIPPPDAPVPGPYEACYRIAGNQVWFWGDESKGFPGNYPGAQFAVYGFLKNELGVRWVSPGKRGIAYRRSSTITLPDAKNDVYRPPCRLEILRTLNPKAYTIPSMPILWDFVNFDPVPPVLRLNDKGKSTVCIEASQWVTRHRLFSPDPPSYGHAFTKWQERFKEDHPEYMALNENGTRGDSGNGFWAKLCVSNPDVHDQIIADWKAEGCPRYINVCENDGAGFCHCAGCRALDADRPGEDFHATKSDRYLWFANRIAEKAIKIRPDVQVSTYIYAFYRHPPRRERIEYPDNMVFGAVPSLADDSHAFFEGWKRVGMKQFFLRPNFHTGWCTLPQGNEKRIYDVYQDGLSFGLIGCDFDAVTWRNPMSLEFYVTARMMEDPKLPFKTIMAEYCRAYGGAAMEVATYISRIRQRRDAAEAKTREQAKAANLLDDSGFTTWQMDAHSDQALVEDQKVLEAGLPKVAAGTPERRRLEDLIVHAGHYVLVYRFFEAARHKDDAKLAAAGKALIDYRIDHRSVLVDAYEQVMNSRYGGTEGIVWKRIPQVLQAVGGMTERTGLKDYN